MRLSAKNVAQDSGIPHSAYPQYGALEWVPSTMTPQEANPIYRPQPRYWWGLRTLSPQPRQAPDYRPKGAPPIIAETPPNRMLGIGPIGPRNTELDLGRRQPGAPRIVVPGSNAALAVGPSSARVSLASQRPVR